MSRYKPKPRQMWLATPGADGWIRITTDPADAIDAVRWHRMRRKYRARAKRRAAHWGSAAAARRYHGYLPRFFGGPLHGRRADHEGLRKQGWNWISECPFYDEYVPHPVGHAHMIHRTLLHLCGENPYKMESLLAGSRPAETAGVTLDTSNGSAGDPRAGVAKEDGSVGL